MSLYNFLILLSPTVVIIAVLIFTAAMRYITYRERVALVERGVDIGSLYRSQRFDRQGNRGILWAGVITATSGLGLLLGLSMFGRGIWLTVGFVPLCIGLGMLGIYYVTLEPSADRRVHSAALRGEDDGRPASANPPAE